MGRQGLTRRAALRLGMAGAGTAVIAACAPASAPGPSTAATGPKRGGEVKIAGPAATSNNGYDPHMNTSGWRPQSLMFEGLTQITGSDYVPKPLLAESWTSSTDAKTWTFKIRQGVRFHNGRAMTADDVKYSFERIVDPKTTHPARGTYANIIAAVDAPNPTSAVFTLKSSYSAFPTLVSAIYQGAAIVPKEEVAKGNFGLRPVGTGPFRFKEEAVDQYCLMERNPDYWMMGADGKPLPYLDAVRGVNITDQQAQVTQLRAGTIDLNFDAAAENYARFQTDSNFKVYGGTGSGHITWSYLNFNFKSATNPPLRDKRVMQAVAWTLDRQAIVAVALPGLAEPISGGILPNSHWAALKEPVFPKPDLAKAKKLMADAGVPNGFKATLGTNGAPGGTLAYFALSIQAIQQQVKQIGIDLELRTGVTSTAADWPKFDLMSFGSPGTPDPDGEVSAWFLPGGVRNWYGYEDPKVTDLAARGRSTADQAARAAIYQELQRYVAENGWTVSLFQYNKYDVAGPYIKNYKYFPSSRDIWSLREVWLDK